MNRPTGCLTLEHLASLAGEGTIDTVIVGVTDLYGRLVGKRFDAGFFLEEAAEHGTHGCDYLLTVDMEMEPVPGYAFANWEQGYGDVHLVPDLATLRRVAWLDRTAVVLCDVVDDSTGDLVPLAPRSLLKSQVAAAADWTAQAASELEYYLFRNSYRDAARCGYAGLEAGGWYLEDYHLLQGSRGEDIHGAARRHLAASGIPVENTKGEWGLGQHELNIRYAPVLEMADRHILLKQCLKETADAAGAAVTFMAKFDAQQAGSSCHVHISLWQGETNAFAGEDSLGPIRCSQTFRWFLGGFMHRLPELMVLLAPTVNSYKRYQSGSWAPTRIAWSHDNRTAGFRVVGHDQSLRIECRVPGADCNPYLVYAAALAAGLDGIAEKREPPPHHQGDVYQADQIAHVPASLREASDLFTASEFARATFGDAVVDHYTHFFRNEQAAYAAAVTDWERKRYFERI
ncbi:MAG: glutamine synthetase [Planctomycetaceae bacterium]|jgi:glutamine synthetase|nr:glutamine synthetase [Planctomycetaceae bacterium]